MYKKVVVLILFGIILSTTASARDWYVDNSGAPCSNTGAGDFALPLCDITTANQRHNGGDSVFIMPGEYHERMFPKSGTEELFTVYSGYGTREQVKILGSDEISGWTEHNPNIYRTSFTPENRRCEEFDGNVVYGTDCFEDRTTWLSRESSLGALNQDSEFYFDRDNFMLYFYSATGNPSSRKIECSSRMVLGLFTVWDEHPPGYTYPSYFTIQNFTVMHSIKDGMRTHPYTHHVNVLNNEFAYNSGEGGCAGNPTAIIHHAEYNTLFPHFNVIGNIVHDQGSDLGPFSDGSTHGGAGIEAYSISDSRIADNIVYNVNTAILPKGSVHRVNITNNTLYNFNEGITMLCNIHDVIIEGNVLYYTIPGSSYHAGVLVRGEAVQCGSSNAGDNTNNIKFYHNVFYDLSRGIVLGVSEDGYSEGHEILNNIFYDIHYMGGGREGIIVEERPQGPYESDYNLVDEIRRPTEFYDALIGSVDLANWKYDDQSVLVSNPSPLVFFDLDGRNFHLDPDSPAIDKGTWIADYHCDDPDGFGGELETGCRHWSGADPDIGAFEFTGPQEIPPQISDIECYDGSSWVNCITLGYDDTIAQVHTTCTSLENTVTNAHFRLDHSERVLPLFDNDAGSVSTPVWSYNNEPDIKLESGTYTLEVTCTDDKGQPRSQSVTWTVPWGTLSASHNSPIDGFPIGNGNSFTYRTTLTCSGGDCGVVTATLDPILSVGKPVTASAVEGDLPQFAPENVVDNNMNTRWASDYTHDSWIYVDLEDSYPVDNVVIYWEAAYGREYRIQVSDEANTWVDVFTETNGDGGTDNISFSPESARYVRMQGDVGGPLYSIWEFEVYGDMSAKSIVPEGSGSPFYTTSNNPQVCGDMKRNDDCVSTWNVVANGDSDTYEFYVIYSSVNSGGTESPHINIIISDSACTLPLDQPTCGEIDNLELLSAISAWKLGTINMPGLLEYITLWKAGT